ESRSDKATNRERPFNPKNASGHQRKSEKTVSGVSATDRGNGFQQKVRARRASAKLDGKPEDACSRDKSQEGQGREIAGATDAPIDRLVQRGGGHLPYGMMQPGRGPARILD